MNHLDFCKAYLLIQSQRKEPKPKPEPKYVGLDRRISLKGNSTP